MPFTCTTLTTTYKLDLRGELTGRLVIVFSMNYVNNMSDICSECCVCLWCVVQGAYGGHGEADSKSDRTTAESSEQSA